MTQILITAYQYILQSNSFKSNLQMQRYKLRKKQPGSVWERDGSDLGRTAGALHDYVNTVCDQWPI